MFGRVPFSSPNSGKMCARSCGLAVGTTPFMVPGFILIAIGAFLVMRNRWVAVRLGVEPGSYHLPFFSSVARQNIAVIGAVMFATGVAFVFMM
jgi:hypothetical protein